jgi:hypothetical protein
VGDHRLATTAQLWLRNARYCSEQQQAAARSSKQQQAAATSSKNSKQQQAATKPASSPATKPASDPTGRQSQKYPQMEPPRHPQMRCPMHHQTLQRAYVQLDCYPDASRLPHDAIRLPYDAVGLPYDAMGLPYDTDACQNHGTRDHHLNIKIRLYIYIYVRQLGYIVRPTYISSIHTIVFRSLNVYIVFQARNLYKSLLKLRISYFRIPLQSNKLL